MKNKIPYSGSFEEVYQRRLIENRIEEELIKLMPKIYKIFVDHKCPTVKFNEEGNKRPRRKRRKK